MNYQKVRKHVRELDPSLDLLRGAGHWYFTLDRPGVFETHSVYTLRLSDLSLEQWMEEAQDFLDNVTPG